MDKPDSVGESKFGNNHEKGRLVTAPIVLRLMARNIGFRMEQNYVRKMHFLLERRSQR